MDYFIIQTDINENMRASLVNWLIKLVGKLSINLHVFFSAIALIDEYLSKKKIIRSEFQKIGAVCILLSSKMEEVYAITIDDLIYELGEMVAPNIIKEIEINVLDILRYKLNYDTVGYHVKAINNGGCQNYIRFIFINSIKMKHIIFFF